MRIDIVLTCGGSIVVVIVWLLDLQLPAQSVLITTKVVSLHTTHSEVYVTFDRLVFFFRVLRFPAPIKLLINIIKILLKVALNTINHKPSHMWKTLELPHYFT